MPTDKTDARYPGPQSLLSRRHRVATWLAWWVLMMSLWVAVDDSLRPDELLAGAAAAALAALAAEAVSHQAGTSYRVRASWFAKALSEALSLPGKVAVDTFAVFAALAKGIATRTPPRGEFREIPVAGGGDSPLSETRRVLLTGYYSFTPNAFVIGIDDKRDDQRDDKRDHQDDDQRDVMLVHELVTRR